MNGMCLSRSFRIHRVAFGVSDDCLTILTTGSLL